MVGWTPKSWIAVSWLLAFVLLTAAFPVHEHGALPAASAIAAPQMVESASLQAPCTACRLLQTSALLPVPAMGGRASAAAEGGAPPTPGLRPQPQELSDAAPRAPPGRS